MRAEPLHDSQAEGVDAPGARAAGTAGGFGRTGKDVVVAEQAHQLRGRLAAAVTVVVVSALGGCGVFAGKHEVGECVRTQVTLSGTDIETVDCPADDATMMDNISDPVYHITDVLDYDASCPNDDQWGIELKHEPEDAVYCLVPVV